MLKRNIAFVGAGIGLVAIGAFAAFLLTPRSLPDLPPFDPAKYPNCVLRPVPADHVLVVATANGGSVLTNIRFGTDQEPKPDASRLVHVAVAPGDRPITVFVGGINNMIWRFEGDVQRVQRVVALSKSWNKNVAVGGIPRDRIEFLDLQRCGQFGYATQTASDGDIRFQQRAIRLMFGRKADHVVSGWQAYVLQLPEPKHEPEPKRVTPRPALRFFELDPKDLVSDAVLSVLTQRPGALGLSDLERDGSIRPPRPDEIDRFADAISGPYRSKLSPDYKIPVRFDYVVTRQIALPIGLYGVGSKHFLVLDGVPSPTGDRAHSCIAYMDGYRMEDATACIGRFANYPKELAEMPTAASLTACRLWKPPAGASMQGVSIYGRADAGDVSAHSVPATVIVRVSKPGNVVLVLNAHEGIRWNIEESAGAHVAGVLAVGHDRGDVRGLPADRPVWILYRNPEKPDEPAEVVYRDPAASGAERMVSEQVRGRAPCFEYHQYSVIGEDGLNRLNSIAKSRF
jgi:hypothetical protein